MGIGKSIVWRPEIVQPLRAAFQMALVVTASYDTILLTRVEARHLSGVGVMIEYGRR